MALHFEILHKRLFHQCSSLGYLAAAKSREATFQFLPCTHDFQQALLATYPTATPRKRIVIPVKV
jgi:hypothetical protein